MAKRILEMSGVGCDKDVTTVYVEVMDDLEELTTIEGLPRGWEKLRWYRMCQSPCLWGDDILLAVDDCKAYSCFDESCTLHDYGGPVTIKAHALVQCAVSCGVFSIEETCPE